MAADHALLATFNKLGLNQLSRCAPYPGTFMDNRCYPYGVPPFPDVNLCHIRPASSRD